MKENLGKVLTKGFLKENPVLRLLLGLCPALAVSTSIQAALGMGAAVTAVLLFSNVIISALRRVIPDRVRVPAYIVIIAGFVTVIQLLVKAFMPVIDHALGIYLPLIVCNCIILGRADGFASRHSVAASICDAVGIFSLLTFTKLSCLHLGQNSGKFISSVSLRIFTRVLFLHTGQISHSVLSMTLVASFLLCYFI